MVLFLDPVQVAPLLPAPVQASTPLNALVQAPPVVPAPVLALPPLPAPIQTSLSSPAPVQAPPSLPAAVQAHPSLPAPVQAPTPFPAPVQTSPILPALVQAQPPLSAPVQAPAFLQVKSKKDEEEDKLSDVETEGYCDDKNPPDIITKLRTVKGQGMKDLYDNTDQVILTISALVSLLEVFFPSFY